MQGQELPGAQGQGSVKVPPGPPTAEEFLRMMEQLAWLAYYAAAPKKRTP